MRGLLLTGGGARGAYQAGVLLGISEALGDRAAPFPFPVLTGISAGAINAVGLAARAPDFGAGARGLADLWRGLTMEQVFRTDAPSLFTIGLGWMKNLLFGGVVGHRRFNALLNPSPLRALLGRVLDFDAMRGALAAGHLRGVAVVATHYGLGASVAFVEAWPEPVTWTRARRLGVRATLALEHVLASTAIPFIFPSVPIGGVHYGDGAIHLTSPFSPAIHLGADRILAVGMRRRRPPEAFAEALERPTERPTAAALAAGVLNAVFLDAIEGDLERLTRINTTLSLIPPEAPLWARTPLKPVAALMVSPSKDPGALARPHLGRFPPQVRYLLRGVGADQPDSADFLSYILFDGRYCGELVELGRADALARRHELEAFLAPEGPGAPPPAAEPGLGRR